jgi:hypothetical protein
VEHAAEGRLRNHPEQPQNDQDHDDGHHNEAIIEPPSVPYLVKTGLPRGDSYLEITPSIVAVEAKPLPSASGMAVIEKS